MLQPLLYTKRKEDNLIKVENNMKKYFKQLFILGCMLFMIVLTGCTSQEYSLQVNDDDTCSFTCQVTVNRDVYSLLATYDIDTAALNRQKNTSYNNELDDVDVLFQELAVIYSTYDFKITPINDTTIIGFKANKVYPNIEEANKEIKNLKRAGLSGFDFEITHNASKVKNEYTVYGTLDYILDPDIDMENKLINENFLLLFDTSILTAKATVITPMSVPDIQTDGTLNENMGYVWTASYDEGTTTDVHIIASKTNNSYYYIALVIIVIIGVIAGIFISRFIRKKKAIKNADFYASDSYEIDDNEE